MEKGFEGKKTVTSKKIKETDKLHILWITLIPHPNNTGLSLQGALVSSPQQKSTVYMVQPK